MRQKIEKLGVPTSALAKRAEATQARMRDMARDYFVTALAAYAGFLLCVLCSLLAMTLYALA